MGTGGFGGGSGGTDFGGGGGAGFGGAVFVQDGATLTISGTSAATGGSVTGGAGGTVGAGGGSAAGSGLFLQNAGVTLSPGAGETLTISDDIGNGGNAGSLTIDGAGTVALTGNNTFSGGVTVAGGTFTLGSDTAVGTGAITTTGSVIDFADGVTIANPIVLNSNDTQLQVLTGSAEQGGVISEVGGARPIEKIGDGTLLLSAANTYTGTTTITGDTLALSNAAALGAAGGFTFLNGGTLLGTVDLTLNETSISTLNSTDSTIAAADGTRLVLNTLSPGGGNSVLRFGETGAAGTVVVNNRFAAVSSASVRVDAGTLEIGGGNAGASLLDFSSSTTVAGGATLDIAGGDTRIRSLGGSGTVTNGGANDRLLTVGSIFPGESSTFDGVIEDGATGTTALTVGASHTLTLTGANTFTGTTTVADGQLDITGSIGSGVVTVETGSRLSVDGAALADTAAVTLNGTGNLTLTGSERIGSLAGDADATVSLGSNTLTTGDATDTTFAGTISGTGGLTKEGSGTFTLSGANTYTGATTITGGTLAVSNAAAFGAAGGGTLLSGGTLLGTVDLVLNETLGITAGSDSTIAAASGKVLTLTGLLARRDGSTLRIGTGGADGVVEVVTPVTGLSFNGTTDVAIDAGTLRIGSTNSAAFLLGFRSVTGTTLASGAVLDLNGFSVDVNALSGTGTVRSDAGEATLRLDGTSSFGGVMEDGAGVLSLIKNDGGTTTTLTGTNTYTVSGGHAPLD